ncbi:MAG: cytochrome c [Bacteroidota bacterium]
MSRIILISTLCALMLLLACGSEPSSTVAVNAGVEAAKPDGEKIYKTYCVTCHGLYGNMGGSGAYDLTVSELSLEERVLVITNGRNLMTPFKSLLDEKEIKAVAKYTMKLSKKE